MEMIETIKVDKETEEIIRQFVCFCYNHNIDDAEDIGAIAAAIEGKYKDTSVGSQTINIMYE